MSPVVESVTAISPLPIYVAGDEIKVAVKFSEAVRYTPDADGSTINLDLSLGPKALALYESGDNSDTLIFSYIVNQSNYATNLEYGSVSSLSLNADMITDLAGNMADVTLPLRPMIPGSLSLGHGQSSVVNVPVFNNLTDGKMASGTLSVQVTAKDADGVAKLEIINSNDLSLIQTASLVGSDIYSASIDTSLLPDGDNYIQAAKTDISDNVFYSEIRRLIIDNNAPTTSAFNYRLSDSISTSTINNNNNNLYLLGNFVSININ